MKKLTEKDIVLIGEGKQIRRIIEKDYKDLKEFHKQHSIPLAYSTFRGHLGKDKIFSDTLKCAITKALNMDFDQMARPKKEQLRNFVYNIYENIKYYNSEEDYNTLEALLKLCQHYKLTLEISLMYRAKARNFYYRNKFNFAVEFYERAIQEVPQYDKSRIAFFYSELADLYSRENSFQLAEQNFIKAFEYIGKGKADAETLFTYNYYIGLMHYFNNRYAVARGYFINAFEYAERPIDKCASLLDIGLMHKKENQYDEALKYYLRALDCLNEDMTIEKGSVYNNIAELYRMLNDYENAVKYMDMSLEFSDTNDDDFYKYHFYTGTYVEIQIQMGNYDACDKYFESLLNTRNKAIDKMRVINGIKNKIDIIQRIDVLDELSDVVLMLRGATDNKEYGDELCSCLGLIFEKIKALQDVKCHAAN